MTMLLTILIIWAVFAFVFALMRLVFGIVFLPLRVLFRPRPRMFGLFGFRRPPMFGPGPPFGGPFGRF